ncbi:MAG: SUMF1/EgtB/PvdO family nonheme iron enzyme [Bacteroidota bacterium]
MKTIILIACACLLIMMSSCIVVPTKFTTTIRVMDSLRMDEYEVSVEAWLSYYSYVLRTEGKAAAVNALPDSNAVRPEVWAYINNPSPDSSSLENPMTQQPLGFFYDQCSDFIRYDKKHYLRGECPFLYVPVTGISYQQAVDFCEWRTLVAGRGRISYRLPTETEWKQIVYKGLTDAQKSKRYSDSMNASTCSLYNHRLVEGCHKSTFYLLNNPSTTRIASYFPNELGVYDLFGNVSEMVAEKGVSKGGNYQLYGNKCHIDSIQGYSKPEQWLGFRCVAEEVKK